MLRKLVGVCAAASFPSVLYFNDSFKVHQSLLEVAEERVRASKEEEGGGGCGCGCCGGGGKAERKMRYLHRYAPGSRVVCAWQVAGAAAALRERANERARKLSRCAQALIEN